MINRSILVGRLTRDPELRYTQGGTAVATFTLAVNRTYTNQNGQREADFINCVVWRKGAENFAKFTHKGSLVGIDGQIQTRNYENQQQQRVYVTEIVVGNFSLLESKAESEKHQEASGRETQRSQPKSNSNSTPTDSSPDASESFSNNGDQIDISDDDLPF